MVTIVLWVIFYGLFVSVVLPAVVFLFGCSPGGVFTVFGVARSTIFSGASVTVLWAGRLGAAFGPLALGLCLGGFVRNWIFFFIVASFFRRVNHVHIVRRGGHPTPSEWRVSALLHVAIVVHTVDVFGAIIKHVG